METKYAKFYNSPVDGIVRKYYITGEQSEDLINKGILVKHRWSDKFDLNLFSYNPDEVANATEYLR